MIVTVDKNKDGKINYSEFRVGFANKLNILKSYEFDREKLTHRIVLLINNNHQIRSIIIILISKYTRSISLIIILIR